MPSGNEQSRYATMVAANVARARKARGWTQPRLAKEIGESTDFIALVESGQLPLGIDHVEQIAAALGVSPYQLTRPQ